MVICAHKFIKKFNEYYHFFIDNNNELEELLLGNENQT